MLTIAKLLLKGIYDLRLNKWEHFLTLCAIALVSFLGMLFFLFLQNIQNKVLEENQKVTFTVYWEQSAQKKLLVEQWNDLQKQANLTSIHTYTSEQAFSMLKNSLGMDVDFKGKQKKLPPTAVLTYTFPPHKLKQRAKEKYVDLKNMQDVKNINYNEKALNESSVWLKELQKIIWPLILFLMLLIGLIVGNTFKIAQISKQEEIEVLKLIGAGDCHIRIPLFSGATVQAILGGGIALGFLKLAQTVLNNILNTKPLWISLEFLNLSEIILLLGGLIAISLISSWVAIRY